MPAGCVARGARARPSGLNRLPMRVSFDPSDGTWRSPVAHLNGVQGVAGSNPAVPILQPAASQPFTDVGPLPFPLPAAAFATDPARFPASTTPSIVSASAAVASFKRCAVLSTGDRLDACPRQILPQRRPETSVRMGVTTVDRFDACGASARSSMSRASTGSTACPTMAPITPIMSATGGVQPAEWSDEHGVQGEGGVSLRVPWLIRKHKAPPARMRARAVASIRSTLWRWSLFSHYRTLCRLNVRNIPRDTF